MSSMILIFSYSHTYEGTGDVVLGILPLFGMAGLLVLPDALCKGKTVVIAPLSLQPKLALHYIQKYQVSKQKEIKE